jgi:PBP1b-binding outer membrane lipoprotein LpoB
MAVMILALLLEGCLATPTPQSSQNETGTGTLGSVFDHVPNVWSEFNGIWDSTEGGNPVFTIL